MDNEKIRKQAKVQIITSVVLFVSCMGGYFLYQLLVEQFTWRQIIQSFYPLIVIIFVLFVFSIIIVPFEIRKRRNRLDKGNISERENE